MNQNATQVQVVVTVNGAVVREFCMNARAEYEIGAWASLAVFTYNNYAIPQFHFVATTANGNVFAEGDIDIVAEVAAEQAKADMLGEYDEDYAGMADAMAEVNGWEVKITDCDGEWLATIPAAWQDVDGDFTTWTDVGDLGREAFKNWVCEMMEQGDDTYKLTLVKDGQLLTNTTTVVEWSYGDYVANQVDWED